LILWVQPERGSWTGMPGNDHLLPGQE